MPTRPGDLSPDQLPERIPVFPLSGAILLPRAQLPLNIFEPRYLAMIDDALKAGHRMIGMVQPVGEESFKPALADVGGAGRIVSFQETGDGRYLISLQGVARFRLAAELDVDSAYRQVETDWSGFEGELEPDSLSEPFDRAGFEALLKRFFSSQDLAGDWDSIKKAPGEPLINQLSMVLPFGDSEKQALLETPSLDKRLEALTALMQMASAGPDDGPGGLQ